MEEPDKSREELGKNCAPPRKSLREHIMERRREMRSRDTMQMASTSKPDKPLGMEGRLSVADPYFATYEFIDRFRKQTVYGYIPSVTHNSPWDISYPETVERCKEIHRALHPYVHRFAMINQSDILKFDENELLELVHTPEQIETVRRLCENGSEEEAQQYDSVIYNGMSSYNCALMAARMALTMTLGVAQGKYFNGFANIRPPGHHAGPKLPNGYCLFNNVAIAAQYVQNMGLADRILIVDFDVHHGQGTQEIFYETDKVLYFSIHRYEYGTFWPNLKESNFTYIGEKAGKGFNINVPLNDIGCTDTDYLAIVHQILLPIAYEYNPQLVLVSGGYDSCVGCPEGRMKVTPAFYGHLITCLSGLADGKVVVLLEGGYFLPSLADGALHTVRALLGEPSHPVEHAKYITPSVIDTINNVKTVLRSYWRCMQIDPILKISDPRNYDKYNQHVVVERYIGKPEKPPYPTKGCYPLLTQSEDALCNAFLHLLHVDRYRTYEKKVGYMMNSYANKHDPAADQRRLEIHSRAVDIMKKLNDFRLIKDQMVEVEFHGGDVMSDASERYPSMPSIWPAVVQQVKTIHDWEEYLHLIKTGLIKQRPDFYISERSWEVSVWSNCILIWLCQRIRERKIASGVAIIRPPGHHAKKARGAGFCVINNVVICADYLIKNHFAKKVLIVDFDVHHGNGTQELTYNRNDIMYISMHRYDNGKFFPKETTGDYTHIGEGSGAGYNINIPFNNDKMENVDYIYTWIRLVLPLSYAYNPDIIIVSAGFDAGVNDPLGNYNVAPETFGHMIQMLKSVAPCCIALEGGYNLETVSLSMVNVVKALLGHPMPMPQIGLVKEETKKTIQNVLRVAKKYWPVLEVNKTCDPIIRTAEEIDGTSHRCLVQGAVSAPF